MCLPGPPLIRVEECSCRKLTGQASLETQNVQKETHILVPVTARTHSPAGETALCRRCYTWRKVNSIGGKQVRVSNFINCDIYLTHISTSLVIRTPRIANDLLLTLCSRISRLNKCKKVNSPLSLTKDHAEWNQSSFLLGGKQEHLSGAFAKLRKASINFVMSIRLSVRPLVHPSVRPPSRPPAWNNTAPIGRIFMKFDIWVFFSNFLRNFKFH
jgi:hypothetical protein